MHETREMWARSLGREDPLEEGVEPTPVFLPGESPGQRSLLGYSPRGHKELDKTEVTEYECTETRKKSDRELKFYLTTHDISQFSSVAQSCPTLCDPMDCSMPGLPVHHQLPEFTQTHVH